MTKLTSLTKVEPEEGDGHKDNGWDRDRFWVIRYSWGRGGQVIHLSLQRSREIAKAKA